MPSHGLQPPKEGQVEKELEEWKLELVRKQEEDELWARIALEVPGGVKEKREAQQLEIEEGMLDGLDATAGSLQDAPHVKVRQEPARIEGEEEAEFDAPLNRASADHENVPYERDRPLTSEELAQAPPVQDGLDDIGGELDARDEAEYFGGIRDEQDPK